jgi:amino acid permease
VLVAVPVTLSDARLRSQARNGVRIALGLLFVWSAATKLLAPRAFAAAISRFDLVPEPALPVVSIGLPLIELVAGLGAVAGRRGALRAILAMLALLSVALGYAFLSGIDVNCGCFGPGDGAA